MAIQNTYNTYKCECRSGLQKCDFYHFILVTMEKEDSYELLIMCQTLESPLP